MTFATAAARVTVAAAIAAMVATPPAFCQGTPAQAGTTPPASPVAVANPTYVAVELEIDVNRPAAEVWTRVGKFCDLGAWLRTTCAITAGRDGELGAVRRVGGRLNEVLVGKTLLSYTYVIPVQEGRPYNLYHGTLEARPVSGETSKLLYTIFFDNSMLADDAARKADIESRRERFTQALRNMKTIAEGGTLPAAPPGNVR